MPQALLIERYRGGGDGDGNEQTLPRVLPREKSARRFPAGTALDGNRVETRARNSEDY